MLSPSVTAQLIPDNIQRFQNDSKGDIQNRRQDIFSGNRVRSIYYNTGEIAQWPYAPSMEWPKGSGHEYVDGLTFMVGAHMKAPGSGQNIHLLETQYREEMSKDPVTGQIWGFEPIAGYNGLTINSIARSNDKSTWPAQWPTALNLGADYDGHWYGYFGKDDFKADYESFYVMDDSKDQKFTRPPYSFYPLASDSTRGGLGLRVEVRMLQWQQFAGTRHCVHQL
jgi:hypothetical protein